MLPVFDTVLCGRYPYLDDRILKRYSKKDKELTTKVIDDFGLLEYKDNKLSSLSGGLLQRVFLARAVVQKPKMLLLDEPTNHLDIKHQIELMEFCENYKNQEDNIVISVLHDLRLAIKYSDFIIALKDNKILFFGDAEKILDEKLFYEVFGVHSNKWKF